MSVSRSVSMMGPSSRPPSSLSRPGSSGSLGSSRSASRTGSSDNYFDSTPTYYGTSTGSKSSSDGLALDSGRRKSLHRPSSWGSAQLSPRTKQKLQHTAAHVKSIRHLLDQDNTPMSEADVIEHQRKREGYRGWSPARLYIHDFLESNWFGATILTVILFNTVLITLQTDIALQKVAGWYFSLIDGVFLGVYLWELILKFYVYRRAFFRSGWNNFDFGIVLLSVMEVLWLLLIGQLSGVNPKIFRLLRLFRAIRAFRALRVLRTITFLKSLQTIVTSMLKSIPAWGSISLLLFLILYIFAIIGYSLFADADPARWGTLFRCMFSLFQMITLDNWFDLYDGAKAKAPNMIIFLITFIIVETFIFINLFIAVIVNNLDQLNTHNAKVSAKLKEAQFKAKKREKIGVNSAYHSLLGSEVDSVPTKLGTNGQDVQHYYQSLVAHPRTKQAIGSCFMLLAALESSVEQYEQQQRTLDQMVDLLVVDNKKASSQSGEEAAKRDSVTT